jgi:hypothetical protein
MPKALGDPTVAALVRAGGTVRPHPWTVAIAPRPASGTIESSMHSFALEASSGDK